MTNPKHTDTSRSGDPVAWMYEYGGGTVACTVTRYEPAVLKALGYTETPLYPADRIEALEAENERLREALEKDAARFEVCADMISDGCNPSGTLRVERFLQAKQYATEARAALGETK